MMNKKSEKGLKKECISPKIAGEAESEKEKRSAHSFNDDFWPYLGFK